MISHPIDAHAESALGTKSSSISWANCQSIAAGYQNFSGAIRPAVGTRYWEQKTTKGWYIYRPYWAFPTADVLSKYPVLSVQLRMKLRSKNVTQGNFGMRLEGGKNEFPPHLNWWDGLKVAVYDEDAEEYNIDWDETHDLVDTAQIADYGAGDYVYWDVPLEDLEDDANVFGGHTFFRLKSTQEASDPGEGATPGLDGEDLGRWADFDGVDDTDPPVLIFLLDLESDQMQQTPVPIEAESRITVTITRRTGSQDADGNWGTGSPTAIASNVVADLQPVSGIASERGERTTGFPEEATHLLIPEEPLPMADHGDDPGIRTGDSVVLTFETGTSMSFEILGINWLMGYHMEVHLKELKARP